MKDTNTKNVYPCPASLNIAMMLYSHALNVGSFIPTFVSNVISSSKLRLEAWPWDQAPGQLGLSWATIILAPLQNRQSFQDRRSPR